MKINLDFYVAANSEMEGAIAGLEEDLLEFKNVCDEIIDKNDFGFATALALTTICNDIYTFSLDKFTNMYGNIAEITNTYISEMENIDEL